MHDIWNPWHGCIKKSEGCRHCYMYFLDKQRGGDGQTIYKVKNNFEYPLSKDKNGRELMRVWCSNACDDAFTHIENGRG